jgi:hypothetical protein
MIIKKAKSNCRSRVFIVKILQNKKFNISTFTLHKKVIKKIANQNHVWLIISLLDSEVSDFNFSVKNSKNADRIENIIAKNESDHHTSNQITTHKKLNSDTLCIMFASLLKTIRVQSMDQIIETRIHAYIAF